MVTLPSLETLGEVHHRLDGFPLEIEFVNAALGYHWTSPAQSNGRSCYGVRHTRFNGSLQNSGKSAGQVDATLVCDFTHLRIDYNLQPRNGERE